MGWLGNPRQFSSQMSWQRTSLIGLLSAIVLYLVFRIGHAFLIHFFPGTILHIELIYSLRDHLHPRFIVFLAIILVGAGEEIFWRGFAQNYLMRRLGRYRGWVATSLLYAGIHLGAANPVLFGAALLAGFAWGWIFLRTQNVVVTIFSHVVWTLLLLFIFPLPLSPLHGYI